MCAATSTLRKRWKLTGERTRCSFALRRVSDSCWCNKRAASVRTTDSTSSHALSYVHTSCISDDGSGFHGLALLLLLWGPRTDQDDHCGGAACKGDDDDA